MFDALLPINPLGKTPYAIHQAVAALFQKVSEPRDYLYRATGEMVRIRVARPRHEPALHWTPVPLPVPGRAYDVSGFVHFDRSPSRHHARSNDHRPFHSAVHPKGWLARRQLNDRVSGILSRCGDILRTECAPEPSMPLGKPGTGALSLTPIRVQVRLVIHDAPAAHAMIQYGIGRGRAFGFGLLDFLDSEHKEDIA